MEQPCWALGCHRSVPPFPHILSLDAKSLLTRAPGTHQTSSPTSLRHGQTHRLQERFYGGGSIEVESCFLSLLLSPVSTSAWSSLVYLAPPGNRLPSWGLSSACPSHSLPTRFWLCATCTISLSSFMPLFCPSILSLPGSFSGAITVGQFVYGKSVWIWLLSVILLISTNLILNYILFVIQLLLGHPKCC